MLDRQPPDQEAVAAIAKMPELSLRRMEALVQSASLYRNERSSLRQGCCEISTIGDQR